MGKCIAKVNKEETHQMEIIYEKKCALENLVKISENNILLSNEELYKRFLKDYNDVVNRLQGYWDELNEKYKFESCENGYWNIDFSTGDIYLEG